jgi:hypothetical protein
MVCTVPQMFVASSSSGIMVVMVIIINYKLCPQLHFTICEEPGVKLYNEHWYERVPNVAETRSEGKVTILWNQQVKTDRTIPDNKPDIIICDNEKGNTYDNRLCDFSR